MTTSRSSWRKLKKQAIGIVDILKRAERGDPLPAVPSVEKIAAARDKPTVRVGIAMDDKFISIDFTWGLIRDADEVALVEYIMKQMTEEKDQ